MEANKKETIEKIIMLVLVIAVFAGIYYFYANQPVKSSKKHTAIKTKQLAKSDKKIANSKDAKSIEQQVAKKQSKKPVKQANSYKHKYKNKISSKWLMTRLAGANKGKIDPFVDTTGRHLNQGLTKADSTSLPDLPGTHMVANRLIAQDPLSLKGFIGEKAIINVEGSIKALSVDETFKGVKVIKIDTKNLMVQLQKDGHIYTKAINVPDNKDFNIIKPSTTTYSRGEYE